MSLSIQFVSLLAMMGTGILAGALIDLIGTSIEQTKKGSFLRNNAMIIEALAWLLIGCGAFYVLFVVRDGAWRMYDPFAQISGMLLYGALFYRPFRFFGKIVRVVVLRPIGYILRLIGLVVSSLFIVVWKIIRFLCKPFFLIIASIRKSAIKQNRDEV